MPAWWFQAFALCSAALAEDVVISNLCNYQEFWPLCVQATAAMDLAVQYTLAANDSAHAKNVNVKIRQIDGGNSKAEASLLTYQEAQMAQPCLFAGPWDFSARYAYPVGEMASLQGIPWSHMLDTSGETILDMDKYPSTVSIFGSIASMVLLEPFMNYAAVMGWRRLGMILSVDAVSSQSKLIAMGLKFGVKPELLFIDPLLPDPRSDVDRVLREAKEKRLSIFLSIFAPFADQTLKRYFFQRAVDEGLTKAGCQWFFMEHAFMERPDNFIRNQSDPLGWAWWNARGLINPAAEPKDANPATWGGSGIYPPAWINASQVFIGQQIGVALTHSPQYETGNTELVGVNCSAGIGGPRCNPFTPPTAETGGRFLIDTMGYYTMLRPAVDLVLRMHKAGLCSSQRSGPAFDEIRQLVLNSSFWDPLTGFVEYECGAPNKSKNVKDCSYNPARSFSYQITLLAQRYSPTAYNGAFASLYALGWNRGAGWLGRDGVYYAVDPKTGFPLSITAAILDQAPNLFWMGNTTNTPGDCLLDTCGVRSFVDTSTVECACKACPEGTGNPLNGSNTCSLSMPDCDLGSAWSLESMTCKVCREGMYADLRNLTACKPCEPGSIASDVQSAFCLQCQPGSVAESPGLATCSLCPPGTYTSGLNRTACFACGPGQTTSSPGATTSLACVCPEDTYEKPDGSCQQCVEGLECPVGTTMPSKQLGYYARLADASSRVIDVYQCPIAERCPASAELSACSDGFQGKNCWLCNDSGKATGPGANKCSGCSALYSLLAIPLLFSFYAIYKLGQANHARVTLGYMLSGALVCGINTFQLTNIVLTFQANPKGLDWLVGFTSVSTLDLASFTPECNFGASFGARLFTNFVPWLATVIGFVVLYVLLLVLSRFIQAVPKMDLNVTINSVGALMQAIFVMNTKSMVEYYLKVSHPSGEDTLEVYPDISAFGSDHLGMIWLHILYALLVVGSFYAYVLFVCWRAPSAWASKDIGFATRNAFLLSRWRPALYTWGAITITRNLVLALVPIVIKEVIFRCTVVVCIQVLHAVCENRLNPWRTRMNNLVDVICSAVLAFLVVINIGFAFDSESFDEELGATLTSLMFALICISILAGMIYALLRNRPEKYLAMTQQRVVQVKKITATVADMQRKEAEQGEQTLEVQLKDVVQAMTDYDAEMVREACQILQGLASSGKEGGEPTDGVCQAISKLGEDAAAPAEDASVRSASVSI